ncbi:hypothetical protein BFJ71_g15512 [Fusarium oxysporum]|nr:hypothetical protein BFJ71_g15512 [Fusarium oxysporum]
MVDEILSTVIREHPIGDSLDAFRASFDSICKEKNISCSPDTLGQFDQDDVQNLVLDVLYVLRNLPAVRFLPSKTSRGTLRSDVLRLISAAASDDFDYNQVEPLLKATLAEQPDDHDIWEQVYKAVAKSTPPPRPAASSLQQTPWLRNTSSFANSSEHRKYVDNVLKEELGPMYVGLRDFHNAYFGEVVGLEAATETFFEQCQRGSDPLFVNGWKGWPKDAKQDDVLSWFAAFNQKLAVFAEDINPTAKYKRRPLAKPNEPIDGSIAKRKMDVGFVNNSEAEKDSRCHWSQILVPGELKSNGSADKASEAWLDLGRYAREVLAAQDTRRFVLGFTLCGPMMRVWAFDRLGGIASEQFDINEDGRRFVFTILGFLWMDEEQLGFDPTIMTANGERFIEIKRNNIKERVIIDKVMQRARCIAGRATTCWKAHAEDSPNVPLVIKDSWQYPEREDEGELLLEVTRKGVTNVARHYYHETVQVGGADDDIENNIRRGLDITRAVNYPSERSTLPDNMATNASRTGHSSRVASRKRPSSQTDVSLPPSKRSRSMSPLKATSKMLPNRVHRRIVIRDYGEPIYKASSLLALLTAFEQCIDGHGCLLKAGILHRDISITNLRVNEDVDNPSWPHFLIDLDLAIKEQRDGVSGVRGKTGTRAFMAIGALLGEQHSFMHDLESFFWVLFWICIHYNTQGDARVVPQFDKWNFVDMQELAKLKLGTVSDDGIFASTASEHFTDYYKPLLPWLNKLRKEVFPVGGRWKREDKNLYTRIKKILRDAQQDESIAR